MTITSNVAKAVYLTNPAVTNYTFPFKIFAASQISVSVVTPAAVETALLLNADYTLTGIGADSGGAVALTESGVAAAGTGNRIVLLRSMGFTQEVDYRPHDIFPAETHERALDILTMQDQELREVLKRAIVAPPDQERNIRFGDLKAIQAEMEAEIAEAHESITLALANLQNALHQARTAAASAGADAAAASNAAARAENAAETAAGGGTPLPASLEEVREGTVTDKFITPATAGEVYWRLSEDVGAHGCNTRLTLAASGPFTAPVDGWYTVTCIGGGGGGGGGGAYDGTTAVIGSGGKQGGATSFAGVINAVGGSGGGGAGVASGGGGGGAGEISSGYIRLAAGQVVVAIIGVGGPGAAAAGTVGGQNGEGPYGGRGAAENAGGGAPGAGGGCIATGSPPYNRGGTGGSGAVSGLAFGGGGGGGGGYGVGPNGNGPGGAAGPGASCGADGTGLSSAKGGSGGPGGIFIEYYDANAA